MRTRGGDTRRRRRGSSRRTAVLRHPIRVRTWGPTGAHRLRARLGLRIGGRGVVKIQVTTDSVDQSDQRSHSAQVQWRSQAATLRAPRAGPRSTKLPSRAILASPHLSRDILACRRVKIFPRRMCRPERPQSGPQLHHPILKLSSLRKRKREEMRLWKRRRSVRDKRRSRQRTQKTSRLASANGSANDCEEIHRSTRRLVSCGFRTWNLSSDLM